MDNLKFKKGLEQNLPKELEKDTFYISTDSKKMRLNDAVWEDTNEIKNIINEKEKITHNALSLLNNKNQLIENSINDVSINITENEEKLNELIETVKENENIIAKALTDLNNKIIMINQQIGDMNLILDSIIND